MSSKKSDILIWDNDKNIVIYDHRTKLKKKKKRDTKHCKPTPLFEVKKINKFGLTY